MTKDRLKGAIWSIENHSKNLRNRLERAKRLRGRNTNLTVLCCRIGPLKDDSKSRSIPYSKWAIVQKKRKKSFRGDKTAPKTAKTHTSEFCVEGKHHFTSAESLSNWSNLIEF